jgi:hypothetical protein
MVHLDHLEQRHLRPGLFGFALLQLVVKGLPEAKGLGRMDVNKREAMVCM